MKNLYLLFLLVAIGCQKRSVPEKMIGYYGNGECYGEVKIQYYKPGQLYYTKGADSALFFVDTAGMVKWRKRSSNDSISFKVETFKLGGGDTLFRKIVVDSSWVDVK